MEGIFLLLLEFDVLVEEANVLLADVFSLVTEAVLDDLLLDLMQAHPRKEFLIKFAALIDHILEMYANLLDKVLRICPKIAEFRVLHIITL